MKEILVKLTIGFILLILTAIGMFKCSSKESEKVDKLLDNGIIFSGIVIDTNVSSNGTFGIIRIKIDSSNVKEYSQLSDNYLFPYRIKDSIAEVYCYVPLHQGITLGITRLKLESNMRFIELFINDKKTIESNLFINTSERNLKYVKKHTIFKDK